MGKNVIIRLENITKSFDDQVILKNLTLDVVKNEFLTLLGPSGCGKTTTLRLIGGFEKPDEGSILHQGKDISNVPPYKRNVNTVFQKYALFPHLNVFENVAFGLNIKKMDKNLIKEKVQKVMKQANLTGYEERKIDQLSGGQQQRVAIARAIVNEPEILLLDEPLGALDLKLRQEMQYELKTLQRELGITFVYVTHDQEEALTMSDTVVVMNNGVIQQMGTPEDIYNEPVNAFVADFIGESNIIKGIMKRDGLIEIFGRVYECVDKGFAIDEKVDVVVRPEDIKLLAPTEKTVNGEVTSCIFKGVHYETCVMTEGFEWVIQNTKNFKLGEKVGINVAPFDIHIMKKMEETGT
ncbi:MAG: ABC transporter ATP-binding protein [Clostridiaceae bacterium]|jgi:spermidine/putrescine transport system ATP-binding protein|nr:ABC transporter ATP-binding protein [Clostridiaceae bacterium]